MKDLVQGAHGVLLTDYVHNVGVYDDAKELGQMAGAEIMHLKWREGSRGED